jgi:hypothetical protein
VLHEGTTLERFHRSQGVAVLNPGRPGTDSKSDRLLMDRWMTEKLAEQGWMVRVETVDPAVVYFTDRKNSSREAINAVLYHPGIDPGDRSRGSIN